MSQAKPAFGLSAQECLSLYNTSLEKGLSDSEVKALQAQHGPNELSKEEPESLFEKIKEQFEDILVRLLLLSAIVSFVISLFSTPPF